MKIENNSPDVVFYPFAKDEHPTLSPSNVTALEATFQGSPIVCRPPNKIRQERLAFLLNQTLTNSFDLYPVLNNENKLCGVLKVDQMPGEGHQYSEKTWRLVLKLSTFYKNIASTNLSEPESPRCKREKRRPAREKTRPPTRFPTTKANMFLHPKGIASEFGEVPDMVLHLLSEPLTPFKILPKTAIALIDLLHKSMSPSLNDTPGMPIQHLAPHQQEHLRRAIFIAIALSNQTKPRLIESMRQDLKNVLEGKEIRGTHLEFPVAPAATDNSLTVADVLSQPGSSSYQILLSYLKGFSSITICYDHTLNKSVLVEALTLANYLGISVKFELEFSATIGEEVTQNNKTAHRFHFRLKLPNPTSAEYEDLTNNSDFIHLFSQINKNQASKKSVLDKLLSEFNFRFLPLDFENHLFRTELQLSELTLPLCRELLSLSEDIPLSKWHLALALQKHLKNIIVAREDAIKSYVLAPNTFREKWLLLKNIRHLRRMASSQSILDTTYFQGPLDYIAEIDLARLKKLQEVGNNISISSFYPFTPENIALIQANSFLKTCPVSFFLSGKESFEQAPTTSLTEGAVCHQEDQNEDIYVNHLVSLGIPSFIAQKGYSLTSGVTNTIEKYRHTKKWISSIPLVRAALEAHLYQYAMMGLPLLPQTFDLPHTFGLTKLLIWQGLTAIRNFATDLISFKGLHLVNYTKLSTSVALTTWSIPISMMIASWILCMDIAGPFMSSLPKFLANPSLLALIGVSLGDGVWQFIHNTYRGIDPATRFWNSTRGPMSLILGIPLLLYYQGGHTGIAGFDIALAAKCTRETLGAIIAYINYRKKYYPRHILSFLQLFPELNATLNKNILFWDIMKDWPKLQLSEIAEELKRSGADPKKFSWERLLLMNGFSRLAPKVINRKLLLRYLEKSGMLSSTGEICYQEDQWTSAKLPLLENSRLIASFGLNPANSEKAWRTLSSSVLRSVRKDMIAYDTSVRLNTLYKYIAREKFLSQNTTLSYAPLWDLLYILYKQKGETAFVEQFQSWIKKLSSHSSSIQLAELSDILADISKTIRKDDFFDKLKALIEENKKNPDLQKILKKLLRGLEDAVPRLLDIINKLQKEILRYTRTITS